MNHYVLHHNNNNNLGLTTPEDDNVNKGNVICPKPTRPLRWKFCQQSEYSYVANDQGAGAEILGIIENNEYSFSPPSYLLGSPPVRVSNPLIQDAQFGCEKEKQHIINPAQSIISSSTTPSPGLSSPSSTSAASSPSSPLRKGGCVRMKFGNIKSAKVRVVGFDCNFPGVAY